jgi:hypothetical protein
LCACIAFFKKGSRAAIIKARSTKEQSNAYSTETIELFLKYETIDARTHGDAFDVAKAEIDALNELIK